MKSGMGFPSKSIGDKYSRAGCVYVGGGVGEVDCLWSLNLLDQRYCSCVVCVAGCCRSKVECGIVR